MKKRTLTPLLISFCLALQLTGCSEKPNDPVVSAVTPSPSPAATYTTAPTEPVKPSPVVQTMTEGFVGVLSDYSPESADYKLSADFSTKLHDVSPMLYGIFFEDINFAADGGLYAEMVQNRSFEFNKIAQGNELHAWTKVGDAEVTVIKDDAAGRLNENNPNYAVIKNTGDSPAGIENSGFLEGMYIKADEQYRCSFYARALDGYTGKIYVSLRASKDIVASAAVTGITKGWTKYTVTLTPEKSAAKNVFLQITADKGSVALDMISLFPADTYKGRENGLRRDLVEKIEALSPSFIRFPGGCVIEGYTLALAYDWKDSVGVDKNGEPLLFNGTYGDVAARKMGQNIWTDERLTNDKFPSFMTYGLGFYEYFLLCEDVGAVGVPVLNCGMRCQGQGIGNNASEKELQGYIQDALDLVEFCRGDSSTKWGKLRTDMGHREPFALKYICIGNEQYGGVFYSNYTAFVEAFEKARTETPALYGDIELIFSAGLDDGEGGSGYSNSYQYAAKWIQEHPGKEMTAFAGATDHHYYNTPEWFFTHNDYYDEANYSRDIADYKNAKFCGGINVFLGEYAARSNTLKAALAEASYMTGLERNSDIVVMAAYAPLFGNTTATHWAPDLIWFNNHTTTASVNYYMQQVFSNNAATQVLKSEMDAVPVGSEGLSGKVGVGTWSTAAKFDNIKITNNDTGEVLASEDFSTDDSIKKWTMISDGSWRIDDGALMQSNARTDVDRYSSTGAAAYFGDTSWENYTYELDATKLTGSEGFLIPFAVKDKNNNVFWNIGGWGNTVSCLQEVSGGAKSGQLGNVKKCVIKVNKTYHLKIVVSGSLVKCYINDDLYIDYDFGSSTMLENYQVTGYDEKTGDIIIKFVNTTGSEKTVAISLAGDPSLTGFADIYTVAGHSLADDNILGSKEAVTLETGKTDGIRAAFNYTVPQYSVTVLRLHTR